jgi:TatD DNase family protein
VFDAHVHLDFPEYDLDRDAVLARARAAGVTGFLICGSDPDRWALGRQLCRDHGGASFLGVHPWHAAELDQVDDLVADLLALAPDGIGEIGLDRLHGRTPLAWERQQRHLRAQLAVARERNLPVVLHGVRAWPELLTIAEKDGLPDAGGMCHAWTGAPDQLVRADRLGLLVSFGPAILYDRARKARQSAAAAPGSRLVVETDGPNMKPPGEVRGEPAHLPLVVAELARLRGEDPVALAAATDDRVRRWLGRPS